MKKLSIALIVVALLVFSGCTKAPGGGNETGQTGAGGGETGAKPTIQQLSERSTSFDYTCDVSSTICYNRKCYPAAGSYVVGNSVNKRLVISKLSETENYASYSLTDFNKLVTYQWSPDAEIMGSKVECYGFSVADNVPNKTLADMDAEIIGRETCGVDGQNVACTHVKYNVYTSPTKESISYVVEQWVWDDYGVLLKAINYRYESYDETQVDKDWGFNMTAGNFKFGPIGNDQFEVPSPCPVTDGSAEAMK